MSDIPTGTPIASKPAVAPPPAVGAVAPVTTAKQPAPPVHPSATPAPEAGTNRIEAARAKLQAPEAPPTAVAAPAPSPAAPAAEAKPAELDVDAAVAKAKAVEAAKVAAVLPEEADLTDKAKRARALADKGDHLGALREMGVDLDAAVKQKTGAASDDPKEKELADLKAENARLKSEGEQRAAQAAAQEQNAALVGRVIADPGYANLTKPEQVEAAFSEARRTAKLVVADIGRALTEAESNRLVEHILGQHNAAVAGNSADKTRDTPPTITGQRAGAAPGSKPKYRTAEEVRRTAFQPRN
jgi:hypothetical protein